MRVTICDRCKKKMMSHEPIGVISLEERGERGTLMKPNPWKDWDLCPSCVADITQYVEAPLYDDEKKKPVAAIKKRQVKGDQIRELAQAGMGVKEIAAEVGCSEQTVRNHMKKEEHEEAADSVSESDQADRD